MFVYVRWFLWGRGQEWGQYREVEKMRTGWIQKLNAAGFRHSRRSVYVWPYSSSSLGWRMSLFGSDWRRCRQICRQGGEGLAGSFSLSRSIEAEQLLCLTGLMGYGRNRQPSGEVGSVEDGSDEVGSVDVGSAEGSSPEVGFAEIGFAEGGSAEAGIAEVGFFCKSINANSMKRLIISDPEKSMCLVVMPIL